MQKAKLNASIMNSRTHLTIYYCNKYTLACNSIRRTQLVANSIIDLSVASVSVFSRVGSIVIPW